MRDSRGALLVGLSLFISSLPASHGQGLHPSGTATASDTASAGTAALDPGSPDPAQVTRLLMQLRDESARATALGELEALGPGIVPYLVVVDPDAEAGVRFALTQVRGRLADDRLAPALAQSAAADPSPLIRYEALRGLVLTADEERSVELLRSWYDGDDPEAKWGAAVALAAFGHGDGLELLHEGVRSSDRWRRYEAITALARVNDARTVRVLAPLILSPLESERRETVLSLAQIGGAEAYLLLVGSLHDDSAEVRWRVAMGLGELGEPRAIVPLRLLLAREYDPKVIERAKRSIEKLEQL